MMNAIASTSALPGAGTSAKGFPASTTVSCVLAVDGSQRMSKEWNGIAGNYLPAILRQLGTLHPNAPIQVSSIVINSLPPTSKRPLVVKPFTLLPAFLSTLPELLSTPSLKGKERESTDSDLDFALLEGLVVGTTLLEARRAVSSASYLILISASDIPNTNFWDEDLPYSLPITSLFPSFLPGGSHEADASATDKGISGTESTEESYYSDAWNALIAQMTEANVHLCTISSRFLPRLEELQRRVASAKHTSSQSLPNLQDAEHAILLSGFQLGVAQTALPASSQNNPHKRPLPESSPVQQTNGLQPRLQGNKKIKMSPAIDTVGLPQQGRSGATPEIRKGELQGAKQEQTTYQQQQQQPHGNSMQSQATPPLNGMTNNAGFQASPKQRQQQLPSVPPSSKGEPYQNLNPGNPPSAQGSPPNNANTGLTPLPELHRQREEIKKQMKQFMQHLRQKAANNEISQEKARATAEKVRQEATKKLQIMDALEAQHHQAAQRNQNGPNSNGLVGQNGGSPALGLQAPGSGSLGSGNGLPLPALDDKQPPLVPSMTPENQQQQQTPQYTPQQQQQYPAQAYQANQGQGGAPPRPTHQRQLSTSSSTGLAGSPQKSAPPAPPVWSGAIKWSLVDPVSKNKKDLAFYVDAIPMRPNAAVELMNVQWPNTMEVVHISPMAMSELQKYSQDNRIQVVQFAKASAAFVEPLGVSQGQNDGLYQLLAKNLEAKGSVAIVKLPAPGPNRGIVIVALPGQNKLVGLIFLTSPLPPRTPGIGQPQQGQMQQQQQAAFQQLNQAQAPQPQQGMPYQFNSPNLLAQQQQQQQQNTFMQHQLPALPQQPLPQHHQQPPAQAPVQSMFPFQQPPPQQQQQQQFTPFFNMPGGIHGGMAANGLGPGPPLTDAQIQEMFQNLQRQHGGPS